MTPKPSIDAKSTPKQSISAIICKDSTKKHLDNYLYKCCFSPALTTFKKAIANGNFITWPGLQEKTIQQYLTETPATAKGHLDQEQKNYNLQHYPLIMIRFHPLIHQILKNAKHIQHC